MPYLNKFQLGCDPEFVALGPRNGIINVERFFPHVHGEVGSDHGGRVVELRPAPKFKAYSLVRQMKRLLNGEATQAIREYRWKAGAVAGPGLTLGGHVHLGMPIATANRNHVTGALDKLTLSLENLEILPSAESKARRDGGRYGHFGDVRASGADNHYEYRAMASWLFRPLSAFVCLTLAKLAAFRPARLNDFPAQLELRHLEEFARGYADRDDDARRLVERIFERRRRLQGDPGVDLRESWEALEL